MNDRTLWQLILLFGVLALLTGSHKFATEGATPSRWFAIRYRWRGITEPVWGTPIWTDEFRALQLKPEGPSELWTWNGATWERRV